MSSALQFVKNLYESSVESSVESSMESSMESSVESSVLSSEHYLQSVNTTKKIVRQLECLGQKKLTIHHTFKNEYCGKKEDIVDPNFEFWDSIRYNDSTTLSDMCDDLRSAPEFSNLRATVNIGFMSCYYSIEFRYSIEFSW